MCAQGLFHSDDVSTQHCMGSESLVLDKSGNEFEHLLRNRPGTRSSVKTAHGDRMGIFEHIVIAVAGIKTVIRDGKKKCHLHLTTRQRADQRPHGMAIPWRTTSFQSSLHLCT